MRYYQIVLLTLLINTVPIFASKNREKKDSIFTSPSTTIIDSTLFNNFKSGETRLFVDKKQLVLIDKSERLSSFGVISHFSGIGISLIGFGLLRNEIREDKSVAGGLSFLIPGSMLDLFGPLFSCAAEKRANELLETAYIFDSQLICSKEYYKGCLFRVVGTSLGFFRSNIPEDANFAKFLLTLGQITTFVFSEVKMIKTITTPFPKINKGKKKLKISLVPSIGKDVYKTRLVFQFYK